MRVELVLCKSAILLLLASDEGLDSPALVPVLLLPDQPYLGTAFFKLRPAKLTDLAEYSVAAVSVFDMAGQNTPKCQLCPCSFIKMSVFGKAAQQANITLATTTSSGKSHCGRSKNM